MSSPLTHKDALGLGAKNKTIIAAVRYFVDDRTGALLNQMATISEITSDAYSANRTASAFDITGSIANSAHGVGNSARPATRSAGPNDATTTIASITIRNLPVCVRHAVRRY